MFELLLLEDEFNVGSTLAERLQQEGFAVSWAKNFQECLGLLHSKKKFAMAVLDVGLPDGNGFDVANILRQNHPTCAVIFLTAFGDPGDRIRGLELGAEDYMVKPFHFKELLLRIRNALKRSQFLIAERSYAEGSVRFGQAIIDFSKFQIERQGQLSSLSHKECAILKLLYDKRGKVVSRDEILDFAWSKEEFPTPRTVDNFIMRLRRLVEQDPEDPRLITSVRGVGYQLDV